jgi:hypothetical protein
MFGGPHFLKSKPFGFFGLKYFREQSVLYFSQKFGHSQAKTEGVVGINRQGDPPNNRRRIPKAFENGDK